ncbi:MAG: preprotein translocase subunit SecG [Sandaracinaceae bacterium]|nr:preprotein translocase subunit SecG [Sandaracinaceae bacterium]
MLQGFVTFIYVLVCAFLIFVVLLQQGRAGVGSAFGSGVSPFIQSSGKGNLLTRATAISATLFMLLSALLAYLSSTSDSALEEKAKQKEMEERNRKELRQAIEQAERPLSEKAKETQGTEEPNSEKGEELSAPNQEALDEQPSSKGSERPTEPETQRE